MLRSANKRAIINEIGFEYDRATRSTDQKFIQQKHLNDSLQIDRLMNEYLFPDAEKLGKVNYENAKVTSHATTKHH